MPTKKPSDMKFFEDHDDQDKKDLAYGEQKKPCLALAKKYKKSPEYIDASNSGDWTPEND